MQENHSDCSRMAHLVLGPSGHVKLNLTVPAQPVQSADPTIQSDPSQESAKPNSSLAPRVLYIKEQGFSESVAA